ncbi:hypothetical protein BH11PSE12_BH11PSE12_19790 [soil metagenome]
MWWRRKAGIVADIALLMPLTAIRTVIASGDQGDQAFMTIRRGVWVGRVQPASDNSDETAWLVPGLGGYGNMSNYFTLST